MWDTSVNSLMFGRMVDTMSQYFTAVGFITLVLGGVGVMNIMLIAVRERTREIGVRKALGATTANIMRQFFLEGFMITLVSGALGMGVALGLCALVNLAPMPERFKRHDPQPDGGPDDSALARPDRRRDFGVSRAARRGAAASRGAPLRDVT